MSLIFYFGVGRRVSLVDYKKVRGLLVRGGKIHGQV